MDGSQALAREQLEPRDLSFDSTAPARNAAATTDAANQNFQPTAAAPDVPAAVGLMVVGAYAWIVGVLWLAFGTGVESGLVLAVSTSFCVMFFAMPAVFLRIEPRSGGPARSLSSFLREGMQTFTGHCNGRAALAQVLSVPLALAVATTGIGIAAVLAR